MEFQRQLLITKLVTALLVICSAFAIVTKKASAECLEDDTHLNCTETIDAPECMPEGHTFPWGITLEREYGTAYPVQASVSENSSLGITFSPLSEIFNNYNFDSPRTSPAPTSSSTAFNTTLTLPRISFADSPTMAGITFHSTYDSYSTQFTRWWGNYRYIDVNRNFIIEHINTPPVINNSTTLVNGNAATATIIFTDEEGNNTNMIFELSRTSDFINILSTGSYNVDAEFAGSSLSHTFINLPEGNYFWRARIAETDGEGTCVGTANEIAPVNNNVENLPQEFEITASVVATPTGNVLGAATEGRVLDATLSPTGIDRDTILLLGGAILTAGAYTLIQKWKEGQYAK